MALNVDLEELAKVLGEDLLEAIRPVVDGMEEDLKEYGRAMAGDALRIVQGTAAADVGAHLAAQARLLAEKHRIRIKDSVLDWLVSALKLAGNVALKVGEKYVSAFIESKIGG